MKSCELCDLAARTYCESDQASLCWDCDAKVHGANFLVERHVRCLLCHACQSLTPWRAAGSKLGHTVSVCERCVIGGYREGSEAEEEGGDVSADDAEEDGDNQVVPWSTDTNTPPPASCSSSSEAYSDGGIEDDLDPLSPKRRCCSRPVFPTAVRAEDEGGDESVSVDSIRMLKEQADTVQLGSDSIDTAST